MWVMVVNEVAIRTNKSHQLGREISTSLRRDVHLGIRESLYRKMVQVQQNLSL